jgi:hypothetical protein
LGRRVWTSFAPVFRSRRQLAPPDQTHHLHRQAINVIDWLRRGIVARRSGRHPRNTRFRPSPSGYTTAVSPMSKPECWPVLLPGCGIHRVPTEHVDPQAYPIRQGQTLILLPGGANRDPAMFEHPAVFDTTPRQRSSSHQLRYRRARLPGCGTGSHGTTDRPVIVVRSLRTSGPCRRPGLQRQHRTARAHAPSGVSDSTRQWCRERCSRQACP